MGRMFLWSFTAAMAGLLFGFDTAVISGVDKLIQQQWALTDFQQGVFIMSSALWGTVVGAMFGHWPTDHLGRKRALILIGWVFLLSSIGSALVSSPYAFAFMRVLGGLAIGASSIAAPTYISEIAPSGKRGMLGTIFQLNIGFGILLAFVSNYLVGSLVHSPNAWRIMLSINAVPAAIFLGLLLLVPESPRWLLTIKGDRSLAEKTLALINPGSDTRQQMAAIEHNVHASHSKAKAGFFSTYRFPILLVVVIAFFNQFSGVNFVVFYAPRILESAGFGAHSALLASVSVGLAMFIFTGIGMALIDLVGRRTLIIVGTLGYIVSLLLLGYAFLTGEMNIAWMSFYMFLFIAAHGIGQGAVIWVFMSEIFPDQYRAKGQAIGTATHWICAAIITLAMPWALGSFGGGPVFLFFAAMMVLALLFALFVMPETKGLSLDQIQRKLIGDK
ncbi:sugar porter family MFS transporter [Carnimonas nigrificans]|uniref:sugar porter family MFS transporter n=1 Tax=Carnimonas nigrificans TaxID=64323 RepID=UPI000472AE73|nr:sugar porter family MFS transporter [Carnimonas nigrificans]